MERFAQLGSERINPVLLWDQDPDHFDWWAGRTLVVQRVVEMGRPEDFCAAFKLYGGISGFRDIVRQVPHLSPIDINFVCVYFHLKKEELRCYTQPQSRRARFNS